MGTMVIGDPPFGFLQAGDGIQLRYGFGPHDGDSYQGAVVVPGGRTEFMEKYLEAIRQINPRGFDAFSFDWRGKGLSARMLAEPTRGYTQTFAHYVADLELFINEMD